MNSKRVISLLLAGQMLGAPLAQASALSPFRSEEQGYPRMTLQTGRTVASAASAIPEESAGTAAETAVPTPTAPPAAETSLPEESAPPAVSPSATNTAVPGEDETTPAPTETSTLVPEESAPTAEVTPVPTPSPELGEPSPAPVPTQDVEETTPTATPDPEMTAAPTPLPTETAAASPSPSASPEVTPVVTPLPSAAPVPVETPVVKEEPLQKAPMRAGPVWVPKDTPPTKEYPFNTPYIGFGYEIYHADVPSSRVENYAVKPAGGYTVTGAPGSKYVAEFAVEKPLDIEETVREMGVTEGKVVNVAEKIEKAAFFDNYLDTAGDIRMFKDVDTWEPGWNPRDDGNYYLEDINFIYTIGSGRDEIYKCLSMKEIEEKWLGRIPDYEFDGWYVAATEPRPFNKTNYSNLPYALWSGYNKYEFTYLFAPGTSELTTANSYVVTRVPLRYYNESDRADYPLTDAPIDAAAMKEIRDKVVVNFENYSPWYREHAESIPYYPGTQDEIVYTSPGYNVIPHTLPGGATNNRVPAPGNGVYPENMEIELPIIAHWKLSSDATLVDNVLLNDVDLDKRETVSTVVYSVKDGKVTTEDLLKNLYDKPFADSTTEKVNFDGTCSQTYYLCVNADIDAIAPRFIAAEAFRTDEAGEGAGVSLRFRAAGEETYVDYVEADPEDPENTPDYELSYTLLNGSREATAWDPNKGEYVTGQAIFNNGLCPLRSQWSVASQEDSDALGTIPLTRATGGDSVTDRYNEVELTITAPDGVTKNVYTFYIQRLNDPYVVQNYGNTPYGMIARESDASWENLARNEGKTVDEVRAITYDRFLNGYVSENPLYANGRPYSFNRYNYSANSPNNVYYPRDNIENNASNYALNAVYDPRAWAGADNVDTDKTAIVVYQDSSFIDPGITVYDSEGRKVDFSGGSVKRSLILRTAASGLRMPELTDAYGQEGYYTGKKFDESGRIMAAATDLWEEAFQTVKAADGKDRIDLRGLNVVPGVYTIEYRFTDAQRKFIGAEGEQNFDSTTGSLFVDKKNPGRAATFTRTLVVLPLPGDVDMDGLVTVADAEALQRELDNGGTFLNSGSKVSSLYYYRVCDVNYDGVVDGKDVSELTKTYIPNFKRNISCEKYFYIPLYTGMSEEEEAAWHAGQLWEGDAAPQPGKGALSLEYLGLHDETITDATALAGISSVKNGETVKVDKNDIFWVGVKVDLSGLTAADAALKKGLAALKLSVIYDPTYLEPAVIPEVTTSSDTDSQWRETMAAYNISGSALNDTSLWPSTYELVESGCRTGIIYDEHYSRSTPAVVVTPEQRPRMLSVVLRNTAVGGGHRNLAAPTVDGSVDRYLLRIPFQVKYVDPNADYLQSLELSLSAQDMGALVDAPAQPAVWSGQTEPLPGGVSANLADELTYVGGSARKIPLADQNLADAVEIKNTLNLDGKAVYGEEFAFINYEISNQDASKIKLPKGLTYDATLGRIEGVIEETGTFTFAVTNNIVSTTYYINVKKAPLKLYAVPQERYYGEPNGELDFRYDVADIQPVDLPGGANYVAADGFQNDGTSEQLKKLNGYQAPSVTTAVTQGAGVGTYDVNITSASSGSQLKNYYFVYADVTLDESGAPVVGTETKAAAKSPMTILPRPLLIGRMTDAAMSSVQVNIDTIQTVFRNTTASYQKDKAAAQQGFEPVALGGNASYPDYKDKLTGDAIYGEDEVTVSFTARLEHESTTPPYYDLNGAPTKQVEATVEALKLTETATNANYRLIRIVDNKTHATVTGNPIVSVAMSGWSNYSGYSSGDTISFNFMSVVVTYEKDNKTDSTIYLGNDAALDPDFGHVYLTWVSSEDKAKGESHYNDAGHLLKNGQELLTGVHNGKYLCVTVLQGSDPISWFSDTPFEVLKRKITLTAKPVTVYYGEYKSDMLDYTYNVNDLTPSDRQMLTDKLGHAPTGSSAELATPGVEGLTNLVVPVLSAWSGAKGTSEEVSADTSVQWDNSVMKPSKIYIENAIAADGKTILSGASEYRFVFTGGPAGQESKYGVSDLNILPRPIMVDTVTMGEGSRAFLYDDTTDWVLRQMYYTENGTAVAHPVTLTGRNTAAAAAADTFVAGAYNFRQEQGKDCYYVAGSLTPVALEAPNPTGDPIHVNKDGKMDNVVITYVATYKRDVENAVPPETPYFTLGSAARKTVPVTVNGLALPQDMGDNGNYKLVYRLLRLANTTSPEDGQTTGLVKIREMKKIEVAADAAKRVYTYGEMLDLTGMTLHVTYESEGDNALSQNLARNVIERTSYYSDTGDGSDSFANQGLQLYWKLDPDLTISGSTMEDSALGSYLAQGKIASTDVDGLGRYPDVAKTGKKLFICGRRFDGDAVDTAHKLVWAEGSASFTVNKKMLPLTVEAKNRYYGEPNRNYQAYYALSDLSLPDQKGLAAAGYTPDFTADGVSYFYISAEHDTESGGREVSKNVVCDLDLTDGVNDELGWLNKDYLAAGTETSLGVRFTSTGLQGSDVGSYSIVMEQASAGNMANYTFGSYTPASLRVFRRPIVVEKILEKLPTIYYNTRETEFPALVSQSVPNTAFQTGLPTLTDGCYDNSAKDGEIQAAVNAGMTAAMPLSGDAIYAGDELSLHMTAVYPPYDSRESFPAGTYQVDQPVTVKDLQIVDGYAKNYFLVYRSANDEFARRPADPAAMGQLDKRPINAIEVLELPKMEYTYGQTLNLSRLKLRVTYGVISGETYPEKDDLFYSQMTGRLSVNYWEAEAQADGSLAPKPLPTAQADYGVGLKNRPAHMGDHLTIAPAHDAGSIAGEAPDFAHNGKYLILTARADEDMKYDAPPVLVNDVGRPVAISVSPLDLTYTLTAADRTYNDKSYASRTAAAGSIALSNVYASTRLDATGGGASYVNDRDLIYVAADKDFDREELSQYVNDAGKTTADAYVFTVDGADQTDRLAFDFYDENVMYYEGEYTEETPVAPEDWADYWNSGLAQRTAKRPTDAGWNSYGEVAPMPVLVSGMRLLGPDAANYTLDEWVGRPEDVAAVFNTKTADPAKSQAPYAVMNKASQSIPAAERPRLSVDARSNVVRLTYETALEAVRPDLADPAPDAFQSEYHYQYGLEYQPSEADPAAMTQWGEWSDHSYFGGEKLTVNNDPSYTPSEPEEEPDEEETVVKGQVYPWEAEDVDAATGKPLFGTREPLARNTVYWGMVRLAETHNYLPSVPLRAYVEDEEDPAVAEAAAAEQRAEALKTSEEMSQTVLDWVDAKLEAHPELEMGPAPAVKTYTQSFEIISTSEEKGADGAEYSIDTLEAVWFTDIQKFAESEELSAVLRNLATTRYYSFYWDKGMTAPVDFKDGGLDLSQPEIFVEVSEKSPDGTTNRLMQQVNLGDDPEGAPRPYSAVLYVTVKKSGSSGDTIPGGISIGSGGGGMEASSATGSSMKYELAGPPETLKVVFRPASASAEGIIWTTSDSRVVRVDENGRLTFVGIGTAVITATTRRSHRTSSVTITVTAPENVKDVGVAWAAAVELTDGKENRFDFYRTDAFMRVDEDNLFHPEWLLTRSELVLVLARFYQASQGWKWSGRSVFPDVSGREAYAEVAELLYDGGIVKGLPDGIFGAGKTATRAEVVTMLCRMMGLSPGPADGASRFFTDCGANYAWANGCIDALAEAGVVKGMGDSTFEPGREITRAELAAMLGRILLTGTYYNGEPRLIPADVGPDHWAYELVLRALNAVVPRTR